MRLFRAFTARISKGRGSAIWMSSSSSPFKWNTGTNGLIYEGKFGVPLRKSQVERKWNSGLPSRKREMFHCSGCSTYPSKLRERQGNAIGGSNKRHKSAGSPTLPGAIKKTTQQRRNTL
jgi:hypothetical protein